MRSRACYAPQGRVLSVAVFFSVAVFARCRCLSQVVSAHWQDYARPVPLSGLLETIRAEPGLKVGEFRAPNPWFCGTVVKE